MTNNDTTFNIPLFYNKHKKSLDNNTVTELELLLSYDISNNSICDIVYGNNSFFNTNVKKQLITQYTTDVDFLKDSQHIVDTIQENNLDLVDEPNLELLWNEIKDDGFKDKFCYVDYKPLSFLNENTLFLQVVSLYQFSSPVISLCLPLLLFIMPYFILKARGESITTIEYFNILRVLLSTNQIGKLFFDFNSGNVQDKIYMILSAAFYIFAIFQNVKLCIKYYNNIKLIHSYFSQLRQYLTATIQRIKYYLEISNKLDTYSIFNSDLNKNMEVLITFNNELSQISEFNVSFSKLRELGKILKYFYTLHNSQIYRESILYSFEFNGYISCLLNIKNNLTEKHVSKCNFTNNKKKTKLNNSYYVSLKNEKHIKNNISMDKNIVITGPNASGKTTTLKATFLNILFSQQCGFGFYSDATISPFHYLHCYLNIPDTSGRDSLFQAEARRCKEFIDVINQNSDSNHLCIFDELYSGTNPEEATNSATSLIKYISKKSNVSFILTTHYINLCKKVKNDKQIINQKMNSFYDSSNNNKLKHTFKIKRGISKIKGGFDVLNNMNYPSEILDYLIT